METKTNSKSDNTLLLIEILVPCCVSVAVLVAVIIFALLKRQQRKEMKYKVKEKEKETRRQGDMMDSLPATMASPYDLVGAYAHFDLGTYDQKGASDTNAAPADVDPEQYNSVLPDSFDGLYTKVKKKFPRQAKLRAVDIIEADLGDGDDGTVEGGPYEEIQEDSYNVQNAENKADNADEGSCKSIPDVEDRPEDWHNRDSGCDTLNLDNNSSPETGYNFEDDTNGKTEDETGNDWPDFDNLENTGKLSYVGDF